MTIRVQAFSTPCGKLLLGSHDGRLCLADWLHRRRRDSIDRRLRRGLGAAFTDGDDALLRRARDQLEAYFAGALRSFDLPLAPVGSEFQQTVWRALGRVPYGATLSYGELARTIGNPGAVRAVAAANGANALSIVIPCHRVLGADGGLTGYAGGLDAKAWLLRHEARQRDG